MNELDFTLDVKSLSDDGVIEGIAAGYGDIDHGGDQMMPGAISASLEGKKSIPMLLFHDQKRPAGAWTEWRETPAGLHVKGRFAMDTDDGRYAHAHTKSGGLTGLSVGYRTLRQRFEQKARQLLQVALHEISLVTVPMHDRARVLSVKTLHDMQMRLAAGDRLETREMEELLKKSLGLSNAEAERAVRVNFAGQGVPADTANEDGSAFLRGLLA